MRTRRSSGATEPPREPALGGARRNGCDRAQAVQRVALDLAGAFLSQPEPLADLVVTLDSLVLQAVAADEHLSVALGKQAQHRHHLATALARDRVLCRVDGPLVDLQVGERRGAL